MLKRLLVLLGVLLLSPQAVADTTNAALTRISGGALVLWSGTLDTNGDVGSAVELGVRTPLSVQTDGTYGSGGTIVLEGSNDGSTWSILVNNAGANISCTAACVHGIRDRPRFIRPRISAGTGSIALNVRLFAGD
jgi:hypothetical protein